MKPDRDLVVYYSVSDKDFGLNLLTHREAGEDGFFIMLVAPSAAFSVVRRLGRARNVRATALYLGIVWFLGGSLGVAVDSIQRLFSGGS